MTPDEAYEAFMASKANEPDLPPCEDIWHAALAYAAGACREEAERIIRLSGFQSNGNSLKRMAARLSTGPTPRTLVKGGDVL